MVSEPVLNILAFMRSNIKAGVETLSQARRSVRPSAGLTEEECLFLKAALRDRKQLEMFYRRFVVEPEQEHARSRSRSRCLGSSGAGAEAG